MTDRQHLAPGVSTEQLLDVLERELGAQRVPRRPLRRVFLDTFDWSVYQTNDTLILEEEPSPDRSNDSILRLVDRESEEPRAATRRADAAARALFVSDLPPSNLRDRIERTVGIRALLPRFTCTSTEHRAVVRNADEKTVLRVVIEDQRTAQPTDHPALQPLSASTTTAELPATVRIEAVRGYDDVARAARTALGRAELLGNAAPPLLGEGLGALGLSGGANPGKPRIRLQKKQSTSSAAQAIGHELSTILGLLEPGTHAATDIEFLHDFRVTVRRARSAIGLMRKALPAELVSHYGAEFKWLGTETTPARDLDVYLEHLPDYERMLGGADLAPLGELLASRREEAYERIRTMLATERYRRLLDGFERALDHAAAQDHETATQPVGAFARQRLARLLRRVLSDGRAITDASPADALHELRKDCKKLRYGLEFFRSLFPSDRILPFVRALKKLQDNLGAHQDYEVQAEFLREVGPQTAASAGSPERAAKTLLSMGALVDRLEHRQQAARAEFAQRFAQFDTRTNRKLAASMFGRRRKT